MAGRVARGAKSIDTIAETVKADSVVQTVRNVHDFVRDIPFGFAGSFYKATPLQVIEELKRASGVGFCIPKVTMMKSFVFRHHYFFHSCFRRFRAICLWSCFSRVASGRDCTGFNWTKTSCLESSYLRAAWLTMYVFPRFITRKPIDGCVAILTLLTNRSSTLPSPNC